jgi:hypothetical protein
MAVPEQAPARADFTPVAVLKRDHFSTIVQGHAPGDPGARLVLRDLTGLPWYSMGLARWLARREARALAAVQGIEGVPRLIRADRTGILRGWTEGVPLNLGPPRDALWYRDAARILRQMRRRGVSHNDLAKPQNWLHLPDGRAGVIDFQLAWVHRHPGTRLARLMGYEDLRHLQKQKRRYASHLLTPSQHRMVLRPSLPGRVWMATGKRLYRFVTRRLIGWSDGEGTTNILSEQGPELLAAVTALPGVRGAALSTYPLPSHGTGLYAFVETDLPPETLRTALPRDRVALVQPVAVLPRAADGTIREDILALIAMNRVDEARGLAGRSDGLAPVVDAVLAGRLNLSDRHRA